MAKTLLLLALLHIPLPLLSFPPKNEVIFEKNCLRLLENGQYSFLSEYFEKNYPLFAKKSKSFAYIEELLQKIPIPQVKEIIINTYLENSRNPHSKIYLLKGEYFLFKNNPEKAKKAFEKTKDWRKWFYLGKIYKEKKQFPLAKKLLLQFIQKTQKLDREKKQFLVNQANFLLAEIYFFQKNYQKSSRLLVKVPDNIQKYILLYYIQKKQNKYKKIISTIKLIQNYYQNTLLAKRFLIKQTNPPK